MEIKTCEPCIYGMAHRLPFRIRNPQNVAGELISADQYTKYRLDVL